MPTITGSAGNAVPHTTHVPIPTTPRGTTPRPRVSTSPFAGKPVVEFTPEQLARAGYRLAGTGDGQGRARTDRKTIRATDGRPAATLVDRDRIVTMYTGGASITTIHRETGYAAATIRRHLDAAGIDRDATRRDRLYTDAQRDKCIALRQAGASIKDAAEGAQLPFGTGERILRDAGLGGTRVYVHRFDRDKAVAEYLAGESADVVGQRHGVAACTITAAVRDAGHPVRRPGRTARTVTAEQVDRMAEMHRAGADVPTIAAEFGVVDRTVRRKLAERGIDWKDRA